MILQRLGQAVRQQDWFTVLLEIVIVVAGIFIALQVDEWNENRKLRQQESEYLAALADDLQTMLGDLDFQLEDRLERRDAMARAFEALQTCTNTAETRADVQVALDQYQVSPGIVYVGATFEEMVASGALARMEDVDLKRAVAATFSDLERLSDAIGGIRISMPVVDEILWSRVDYGIDEKYRFKAKVDIPSLCESREIRNAFLEMIDIQADSAGFLMNARQRVVDLLARLGVDDIPPGPTTR